MWSESLGSNKILMMKEMRMSWSSNMKKKNRITKENVYMTKMGMEKNLNFLMKEMTMRLMKKLMEMKKNSCSYHRSIYFVKK